MFRRASFVVPPPFFVILGPAFLVILFVLANCHWLCTGK